MALVIENIEFRYGNRTALRNASIQVETGQLVSLVGPNGAGKSTLLKCIAGLLTPVSGHVIRDEREITALAAERVVRGGLALVPEGKRVFKSLTVLENMRLAAAALGDSQRHVRISDCFDLFPKLRSRKTQRAWTLSGGEQQQLMIARSLLGAPRYLLLDEPSMGLSPQIVSEVFEIMKEQAKQGTGVLLVEQFVEQAVSYSDYVHIITRGEIGPRMTGSEASKMMESGKFFELYSGR